MSWIDTLRPAQRRWLNGVVTPVCENCGSTNDVRTVEYDAMVDGPGYVISEERCADCRHKTEEGT